MSTQQRVQSNGKSVQKIRQIEWVIHLRKVADGLMTKLHRLRQILGSPETGSLHYPDSFWKSGIFPDLPKLCQHVARKFPEHPAKLQLEKVHGLCLLSFFLPPLPLPCCFFRLLMNCGHTYLDSRHHQLKGVSLHFVIFL
jgi:hypothetical protein